jgi:hypothetical protein
MNNLNINYETENIEQESALCRAWGSYPALLYRQQQNNGDYGKRV